MKNLITQLIVYIALIWSSSVYAVWYQVELIVFENLYPEPDGELWYKSPGLVDLDDTVILNSFRKALASVVEESGNSDEIETPLFPYTILPDDNYRLNGIYRVLRLSREYRPLYHISWQQPGLDADQAKTVHLQSDDAKLYELTIPATLVTDPMPDDFYEPVDLSLDGALRIRSNLYLYVDLDMVLFRPPPVQEKVESIDDFNALDQVTQKIAEIEQVEYVRLVETRRIKLNELHYFDHPMFGVIIQVSRYGPE